MKSDNQVTDSLQSQYDENLPRVNKMREIITTQVMELISQNSITLGVPMESRVKTWESIRVNVDRHKLKIKDIHEINDLIGIRLILLFKSDVLPTDEMIQRKFDVLKSEDVASRLSESQFGYQSQHYVVQLPRSWLAVPSMADLGKFKVEFQVRTLAQHIWAAASHKLQYKQEDSVPPPLRRTINRVSALLETVDLEFDRVLTERRTYRKDETLDSNKAEPLNTDLIAMILNEYLPEKNREEDELYSELLADLTYLGIKTVSDLQRMTKKRYKEALESERKEWERRSKHQDYTGTTKQRTQKGVFFTHVGLTREMLRKEFGDDEVNECFSRRQKKQ